MTQTYFKNSNAVIAADLDMELRGLDVETDEERTLQDWDEGPKAAPEASFFGSKAHQITRNQLVELYHKVDALNRPDEDDLLDILNEALRDEMRSKRMEKANLKEKAADFEEQAYRGYQEVFGQVQAELGSKKTDEEEKSLAPKFEGDSAASRVDEKAKTAFYEVESNVKLHAVYDDSIMIHDITASGTVTLYGGNQRASFRVSYDEGEKKFVIVEQGTDKNGKPVTETYKVDAENVTRVVFDSKKVDLSALDTDQQKKIQIGTDPDAARDALSVTWPTGSWAQFIPHSDHDGEARDVAGKIDRAMEGTGNWQTVLDDLNGRNSWDGNNAHAGDQNLNDIIRKLVTGLYRASNATDQKDPRFVKLLQKLPAQVRTAMIDWVTHCRDELSEKQGGEMWNSQETADILQTSLNEENKTPSAPVEGSEI